MQSILRLLCLITMYAQTICQIFVYAKTCVWHLYNFKLERFLLYLFRRCWNLQPYWNLQIEISILVVVFKLRYTSIWSIWIMEMTIYWTLSLSVKLKNAKHRFWWWRMFGRTSITIITFQTRWRIKTIYNKCLINVSETKTQEF